MGTVELTLPEGGRSPEGLRVRFRVTVASTRDVPAGGGGQASRVKSGRVRADRVAISGCSRVGSVFRVARVTVWFSRIARFGYWFVVSCRVSGRVGVSREGA